MKSEKLIGYIHHPETIGTETLRELSELVSRYPYFQTARMLYLKALYLKDSARFKNELRTGTVHITNHKQLYRYLNHQLHFDSPDRQEAAYPNLTDVVDERIREIQGHTVVSSLGIPAYPTPEECQSPREQEIVTFNLQPPVTATRPQPVPPPAPRRPVPEESGPVISNPIQLDQIPGVIDDYEDTAKSPDTTREAPAFATNGNYNRPTATPAAPTVLTEQASPKSASLPPMPPERPAAPLTMDLDLDDEPVAPAKPTVPVTPPAQQAQHPEMRPVLDTPEIRSSAYQLNRAEASTTPLVPRKARKKKDELIERFIQTDPGMPKIDPQAADTRDLSKENPYGEEELFSETLAKIYVRQHLYEKAIATYIKLSLKYPEKSVYFAHRIEEIKENSINKE